MAEANMYINILGWLRVCSVHSLIFLANFCLGQKARTHMREDADAGKIQE